MNTQLDLSDRRAGISARKLHGRGLRSRFQTLGLMAAIGLLASGALSADQIDGDVPAAPGQPTLEETRLTMGKWIETQQVISKERQDWLQGKDILIARLELVKGEIASLEEKIKQAESTVAEAERKRDDLLAENDQLKAAGSRLTDAVTRMEAEVRRLYSVLPEPIQSKLQPLYQRIPEDAAQAAVSAAERFQNVLGILNELNKANNEITVSYEVRTLADGKPSEVKVMYVGLAQAYYVSARGEAGIGRPGAAGWTWEPSKAVAPEVLMALEIIQGKQTPEFVPLPVKIQ
jgi:FtsZ-binding cell division protein ZapB